MSSIEAIPAPPLRSLEVPPSVQVSSAATWRRFGYWAAIHAVLGIAASRIPMVSTIHAWGCLLWGLYWVGSGRSNFDLARYAAYVMGAEVMWRMTNAFALWEMGKYTVIAVLGLAALRSRPIRSTAVSTWYIGLLLPSALVTMSELGFTLARKQVSFNLSGPLAISICAAFFSRCRFSRNQLAAVIRCALLPLVSIWSIVVLGIASAKALTFNTESNHSMSGGFGPNQVSMILGLAAMLSLMLALVLAPRGDRVGRMVAGAMTLIFGLQATLTFSRSGLYLAVLSSMATMLFSLKNPRLRNAYLVGGVTLYVLGVYVIFPKLDSFTGGMLSARFSETQSTGRDLLIEADLETWRSHLLFGTGPGMGGKNRASHMTGVSAAHCEVTRLLAEHGLFGLVALVLLAACVGMQFMRLQDPPIRGLMIACTTFGALVLLTNAMRIVAPSMLIGLVFCNEYVVPRRTDHRQPAIR